MADEQEEPKPESPHERVIFVSGPVLDPPTKTPEQKREDTRSRLAGATLVLLGGTIALAFSMVGWGDLSVDEVRTLLEPILPAEIGLASGALAFYFGERARPPSDSN